MRAAILLQRVRVEEKLVMRELEDRGHEVEVLHDGDLQLAAPASGREDGPRAGRWARLDVLLQRCLGHTRALAALPFFEAAGVPTVNSRRTTARCGDKVLTSVALARAGVPQPRFRTAFTPEAALEALDELGYPAVIKPPVGSWGRLLARVDGPREAEQVLEHKDTLGGVRHSVFYLQEHVPKPGWDVRAFVACGETVCAIRRRSDHWITNTARGAGAEGLDVTPELDRLCRAAASAVGGGLVAVDLLPDGDGFLVNEVNDTMEFRNSVEPTGVDVPARVVDHMEEAARC